MSVSIITGDARAVLATLPDESVHCVVSSPPYFGLRDYGAAGQIGLEASYPEYVVGMVAVFREVRRVLRADGTLWLNLGDSYATGAGKVGDHPGGGEQGAAWAGRPALGASSQFKDRKVAALDGHRGNREGAAGKHEYAGMGPMTQPNRMPQPGLKPKDLCGIPWRVAFALQADGWWLRQDIIWSKPNPMPESVRDRCTKAHEYIFLLTKSERYFYDADAIKEVALGENEHDLTGPGYEAPGQTPHTGSRRRASGNKTHKGVTEYERSDSEEHRTKAGLLKISSKSYAMRNKRSVWTVGSEPFPEAHFAVFPPALIAPCIKAGCPPGGVVLDPFGGAGTTGLVADRLRRNAILIELNPEYAAMARRRIDGDAPLLSYREAAE